MIWATAEHKQDRVRLVLSASTGDDIDLRLTTETADELGRALCLGEDTYAMRASTVDDEPAMITAVAGVIDVMVEGEYPYRFSLEPDKARALGERLMARPDG